MLMLSSKIAEVTAGDIIGEDKISQQICINSQSCTTGDTFLAIKGDYKDGHNFINNAIDNGAVIIIVNDDYIIDESLYINITFIKVDDTKKALHNIASYVRDNFKGDVIAITGSVGKTTTKEILLHLLSGYKVMATSGNFNNSIGMPLNLANIKGDEDFIILEMGMDKSGEISLLSKIAKPNIFIITEIALAHMINFSNIYDVAKAKLEIFDGIYEKKNSYLFINKDIEIYNDIYLNIKQKIENIKKISKANIIKEELFFDINKGAMLKAIINIDEDTYDINLSSIYSHHLLLVAICLSVVKHLLGKIDNDIIKRVITFNNLRGRGDIYNFKIDNLSFCLVDDSYNASPKSMQAALNAMLKIEFHKKIFILGDMLELGEISQLEHSNLVNLINANHPFRVLLVGKQISTIKSSLLLDKANVIAFDDIKNLSNHVLDYIESNSLVLVKGSFSTGLYNLVENIRNKKNIDLK